LAGVFLPLGTADVLALEGDRLERPAPNVEIIAPPLAAEPTAMPVPAELLPALPVYRCPKLLEYRFLRGIDMGPTSWLPPSSVVVCPNPMLFTLVRRALSGSVPLPLVSDRLSPELEGIPVLVKPVPMGDGGSRATLIIGEL
jgi:hypothetical protein